MRLIRWLKSRWYWRPWGPNRKSPGRSWKERAEALYQLLDDIDTADDMAKGNDAHYRAIVHSIQKRKDRYAYSPDGYKLIWR